MLLRRRRCRSRPTRPTSCRITPTSATTRRQQRLLQQRGHRRRAAACAANRCGRRQRRLPLWRFGVPDADLQRDELLGRRGVRQHARHDAPQIADVAATPVDSAIAVITLDHRRAGDFGGGLLDRSHVPAGADTDGSDADFVTAHSVRLTGLLTEYVVPLRVRSTDRAGNTAQKPNGGPTPPPAPGQPPDRRRSSRCRARRCTTRSRLISLPGR